MNNIFLKRVLLGFSFVFVGYNTQASVFDKEISQVKMLLGNDAVDFKLLDIFFRDNVVGFWGFDSALDWYESNLNPCFIKNHKFEKIVNILLKNEFLISQSQLDRAKSLKVSDRLISILKSKIAFSKLSILKTIFKQQVIQTIKLSVPVVILYQLLYQIYPDIFSNANERVIFSLLIGLCAFGYSYYQTKTLEGTCRYEPSLIKPELEQIVIDCCMDSQLVNFRYGFSDNTPTMAILNTIIIDPILCCRFSRNDPSAIAITDLFNRQFCPVPQRHKEEIKKIKNILTPEVQAFMLKHKLGYVFLNYSYKKLILDSILVALLMYIKLETTNSFKSLGTLAVLLGIAKSGLANLLFGCLFNRIMAREEKNADLFAAKFSSSREIKVAAEFLEHYEDITGFRQSVFLSGCADARARAKHLRDFAENSR